MLEAAAGVGEEPLLVAEADGAELVVLQVGEGLGHLHQRPAVGASAAVSRARAMTASKLKAPAGVLGEGAGWRGR